MGFTSLDTLALWAQLISLPIAVISILVAIFLFILGIKQSRFECEIESIEFPIIIRAGDSIKSNLQIIFNKKPVENLMIMRIHFLNSGNLPIRRSAIVDPISVTFDKSTEILREPQVIKSKPENIKISWALVKEKQDKKHYTAIANFELINSKEEFWVEFLCTGANKPPKISARIENVKQIDYSNYTENQLREAYKNSLRWGILFAFITSGLTVLYNTLNFLGILSPQSIIQSLIVMLAVGNISNWIIVIKSLYQYKAYRIKNISA
jgi:hypothetical protein